MSGSVAIDTLPRHCADTYFRNGQLNPTAASSRDTDTDVHIEASIPTHDVPHQTLQGTPSCECLACFGWEKLGALPIRESERVPVTTLLLKKKWTEC